MMYRAILSSFIIILTTYLGLLKAKKLYNREYILRECISLFDNIKNEIIYTKNTIPSIIEVARLNLNTVLKDVMGSIVVDMYENKSDLIAFNISKIDDITDYDKSLIISCLNSLGKGDIDFNINLIENLKVNLNNQIKEASNIKVKNSKMYRALGTCVGAIIAILLF